MPESNVLGLPSDALTLVEAKSVARSRLLAKTRSFRMVFTLTLVLGLAFLVPAEGHSGLISQSLLWFTVIGGLGAVYQQLTAGLNAYEEVNASDARLLKHAEALNPDGFRSYIGGVNAQGRTLLRAELQNLCNCFAAETCNTRKQV
jgi:hypothetical protein